MAKKPTGRPNGRPLNKENQEVRESLEANPNPLNDWDAFYDLQVYLEQNHAPSWLILEVEKQIQETANLEAIQVRTIIEDLVIDLQKSLGFVGTAAIMKVIQDFNIAKTENLKNNYERRARKQQHKAVVEAMKKLSAMTTNNPEARQMLHKLQQFKKKLFSGILPTQKGVLKKQDFAHLFEYVGVDRPSEAAEVLRYLLGTLLEKVIKHGAISSSRYDEKSGKLKKRRLVSPTREMWILQSAAMDTYSKIFRCRIKGKPYDISLPIRQRRGLLNRMFHQSIISIFKKAVKEGKIAPTYEKKEKIKLGQIGARSVIRDGQTYTIRVYPSPPLETVTNAKYAIEYIGLMDNLKKHIEPSDDEAA